MRFFRARSGQHQTFAVKIRLNADEAIRRFHGVRRGLCFSKVQIIKLCRMLEKDGRLEQQLGRADLQILSCLQILGDHPVGEREYLGTAVLVLEGLLGKTRDLLVGVHLATRNGQDVPSGFYLKAQCLVQDFEDKVKVLVQMRKAILREFDNSRFEKASAKKGYLSGFLKWFQRPKKDGVDEREHNQREHIFSGYLWQFEGECKCLDYR